MLFGNHSFCSVNIEETASANEKRTEALEKVEKLRMECARLAEERDAAIREARVADAEREDALHRLRELECEKEPITDLWNTHTIEVALVSVSLAVFAGPVSEP